MFSHHAFLYSDLDHYLKIWIKVMMIRYVYIQGYSVVVDAHSTNHILLPFTMKVYGINSPNLCVRYTLKLTCYMSEVKSLLT